MEITEVKIRQIFCETDTTRLLAIVSITLDKQFAVHDIKIIKGDDRNFVAMPSRSHEQFDLEPSPVKFIDIAHPIGREFRNYMEKTILDAYNRFCEYEKRDIEIKLDQPEKAVAFTGYRPQKLPEGGSKRMQTELHARLKTAILDALSRGFTTFINGCMAGWDILAGEAVLELKQTHPEIVCVTVAPFRQSFLSSHNLTEDWKKRSLNVYNQSDIKFCLTESHCNGIYYTRDRFLVDHTSLIICYFDGKPGGTKYTLDYAAMHNREIVNLA